MKQVTNKIIIEAPAAVVWDVLVNGEQTQKYMFGCITLSDWEEGSTLLWEMEHEGKKMIPVSGKIVHIEPSVELQYTVIDPNADYPATDENHLLVTYKLMQHEDETELTVIQSGFENAADGEKRYKDVYNDGNGWQEILEQIKEIAEEEADK